MILEETTTEQVKHAVARLDVRELSRITLHDILSELAELMGEFIEERDYEEAMKHIEKATADDTTIRLRHSWKETYYWPIIQRRAKLLAPFPKSPGPETEITLQEKVAAKRLIIAMGYMTSKNSIFKWSFCSCQTRSRFSSRTSRENARYLTLVYRMKSPYTHGLLR